MKLITISQSRGDHERCQGHARVSTHEQHPGPSFGVEDHRCLRSDMKLRTSLSLSALGFFLRYSLSPRYPAALKMREKGWSGVEVTPTNGAMFW